MEIDPSTWLVALIAGVAGILSSGGFWAYLQRRDTIRGAHTTLLLGLAHDRIIFLGMNYIERGWLTKDEYEDYFHYMVDPYAKFGGNGLAEKVIQEVKKLPISTKEMSVKETINEQRNSRRRNGRPDPDLS